MYYVYIIENLINDKYYIGYTSDYKSRWNSHRYYHTKRNNKLYSSMRKYGFDNFEMSLIDKFETKDDAIKLERYLISLGTDYNLAPGGEGGFVVQNKDEWRKKLSKARKDGKPSQGMRHSKSNKKKFSNFGKLRWDIHGRYPKEVTNLSFKESHKLYGISKTHYYRLLKQAKNNDLG